MKSQNYTYEAADKSSEPTESNHLLLIGAQTPTGEVLPRFFPLIFQANLDLTSTILKVNWNPAAL